MMSHRSQERASRGRALFRLRLGMVAVLILLAPLGSSVGAADLVQDVLRWDEGRSRGNAGAPVVLIEYSDFTCGYCQKFFRETWPKLKANYVDKGQVLFVYKDYPRADTGPGLEGAIAARCAGNQGRYWPMHDRLFHRGGRFDDAAFERHAKALELDLQAFAACRRAPGHADDILKEKAQALRLGFRGTPGFILLRPDHVQQESEQAPLIGIPGALPYEVFEEQIERLLAHGQRSDGG